MIVAILAIASTPVSGCTLVRGPERIVTTVVDGETLLLDDGSTVRLANVQAPRALPADGSPSAIAGRLALDQLARGKAVRLDFDAVHKDRYGMTRAHVILRNPTGDASVQVQLLADGHLRADARHGERGCTAPLLAAEDEARAAGRGLWTDPAFRVRAATPARDLAGFRGTFQIIAGVVASTETARDIVRLVLGPDRRRDLTISFRANDRDILGPLGGDVRALVGKRLEVRGHLDQRPGSFGAPDIDVSLAGHVRILPPAP